MKKLIGLLVLLTLSCQFKGAGKMTTETKNQSEGFIPQINDSLFLLTIRFDDNSVQMVAPKNLDFSIADEIEATELFKFEDFNADGKKDILIFFGGCGTGGCNYGLFLNKNDHYYKLALLDYLKNPTFEKEKNGSISITSSEELKPYDPSRIAVTTYIFDPKSYEYIVGSSYIDE